MLTLSRDTPQLQFTMITADHLTRIYRKSTQEITAVDDVCFSIEDGDYIRIIGTSGSGKSTLIHLLSGLDSPTSGNIFTPFGSLDSLPKKKLAEYRSEFIGMVFQSFNLLPHKTALQNIEMGMMFSGKSSKQRRILALEYLEKLGLSDRKNHYPADLSGGEQQRVAIARAIAKRPKILFADEPTGNLDRKNTKDIDKLFHDMHMEGLTIVLVTHDTALADDVSVRTLRMDYGSLNGSSAITDRQNVP